MEDEIFVCRTCLASNVKLYKLNEPFTRSIVGYDLKTEMKATFAECLNYCTRLEDAPSFPNFICEECSHALQIAYIFIQNALQAHEILAQHLGIIDGKQAPNDHKPVNEVTMRFRCKICQAKVETKKALKEHIKLHLDVISYCCQLCDSYVCKKRSQLSEHYKNEHNVEPSSDQLKPSMKTDAKVEEVKSDMQLEIDEIFAPSEQRQKEQEEAERLLQELEEKLFHEKLEKQHMEESLDKSILVNALDVVETDFNSVAAQAITQNFDNDLSAGNEFVVLPDGTVQRVVASDIVIEYINQDANGVAVLQNEVEMDSHNACLDSMDFDNIIEEATTDFQETIQSISSNICQQEEALRQNVSLQLEGDCITQPQMLKDNDDAVLKKPQCKSCNKAFNTQSDLKTHMLGHSEIPHFFCDTCSFYTFFKKDLIQHYRTKHLLNPSQRQLQPSNKKVPLPTGRAIYNCDLCLYETTFRLSLQQHYLQDHNVVATEVQLRPTLDNTDIDISEQGIVTKATAKKSDKSNFKCKLCEATFNTCNRYKAHMAWHEEDEEAKRKLLTAETHHQNLQTYVHTEESRPLEVSNHSINANVILPVEVVPQIIASEQTIEQTVNFDFNGDEIFEDFDGNNQSIDDDGQDDDELGDLLLTSDDDLDDLLEEHGNDDRSLDSSTKAAPQLRAYCVHCNKRFFSQYHFENHMFIHRGLAPYRCEMCTNLYNKKRALIRHYKAVHKTIPTRDMIQAKGDKVDVDKTSIEHLKLEAAKKCTLMCANCPFESNEENNLNSLLLHLSSNHGITDDNYILQRLPFECPRCIRSYESKASLMRHLERSHSSTIITQRVARQTTSKKSSTTSSLIPSVIPNDTSANFNATGIIEPTSNSATCHAAEVVQQKFHDAKDVMSLLESHIKIENESPSTRSSKHNDTQICVTLYECSLCQGKYKSQALLRHHFKRHVERKFLCELCPKSFICRAELEKHKLLHAGQATGQLPYKCDMCHKQFGYPHHLKRHKDVIHYGKRYACPISSCGKSFTTKAQYNIHKLNHTGNLPYKCKICSRVFGKRETFRQHYRKMHNINLTETEIAEIYRENMGHTNPHDLIVALDNGQMLRRSEAEAVSLGSTEMANTSRCDSL